MIEDGKTIFRKMFGISNEPEDDSIENDEAIMKRESERKKAERLANDEAKKKRESEQRHAKKSD